jgi:hypothetical protein
MTNHIEEHRAGYRWRDRFPDAQALRLGEGFGIYAAQADGAHWIVHDEGTLADFLPEADHGGLIRIARYEDELSWQQAKIAIGNEAFEVQIQSAMRRYRDHLPIRIDREVQARGLKRINERDHLQPWSRDVLRGTLPSYFGCELRTSEKVHFPTIWPRLGDVDIVLDNGVAAPAFFELKCGSGSDALGPCAWDLLKLALCLDQGACSCGFLVVAAPIRLFDERRLGTELLRGQEWTSQGIRERYSSWFRHWEKCGDPPIKSVPPCGRIEARGFSNFEIAGMPWTLRTAQVTVEPGTYYEWQPFLS